MVEVKLLFCVWNFWCDPMGEDEGSDCPPQNAPLDAVSTATPKKLARQLDFNAFPGGIPVTSPLPEQTQPPLTTTLPSLPSAKFV